MIITNTLLSRNTLASLLGISDRQSTLTSVSTIPDYTRIGVQLSLKRKIHDLLEFVTDYRVSVSSRDDLHPGMASADVDLIMIDE